MIVLNIVLITWFLGMHPDADRVPGPGAQPLHFELRDQFGDWHTADPSPIEIFILVGGDKAASEPTRRWAIEIGTLLDSGSAVASAVKVVRLADLRGIPSFLRSVVAKQLRQRYSTPILMDWDGQLAGRFDFAPGLANVAVVDRDGGVFLHLRAHQPEPDQIEQLAWVLEHLHVSESDACASGHPVHPLGASL